MPSRSRPVLPRVAALTLALAGSLAACSNAAIPIQAEPIDEERDARTDRAPEERDARAREQQGDKVDAFTIEAPPLGFKIQLAVPQGGHLCIIIPESAQDPTACLGLDPAAMADALPEGPNRPFGVAHARGGDWSYDVILSSTPGNVESREDIEKVVADTESAMRDATSLTPKVIADTPNQRFDLLRVKDIPVVRFRVDTPQPKDSPAYDQATTLYYGVHGAKPVLITFITSPKDIDKVFPYAEASVQTIEAPQREAPERFGKPRAELSQQSTRTALTIFGPLIAFGVLLFWWLGRSRDKAAAERAATNEERSTKKKSAPAKDTSDDSDANDDSDAKPEKQDGASSEEDAPSGTRPSDRKGS